MSEEDEWEETPADWGDVKEDSEDEFEKGAGWEESEETEEVELTEQEGKEADMVKTFIGFVSRNKEKIRDHLNEIIVIQNKEQLTDDSTTRLNVLKSELKTNSDFKEGLTAFNRSISNLITILQKDKDKLQRDISSKKESIEREIRTIQSKIKERDDELEKLNLKMKRARRSEKDMIESDIANIRDEIKSLSERINTLRDDVKEVASSYEFKTDKAYIDRNQKEIDNKKETFEFIQSLAGVESESEEKVSVVSLIEKKEPIQRELMALERQFDQDSARGMTNFGLLPAIYRNTIELTKIENLIKDNIEKNLNMTEKLKINRTKMENNMKQIQNVYDTLNHRLSTVKMISASNGNDFRIPVDVMAEYKEKIRNLENTIAENRRTIRPFKKIDEETETVMKNMIKDYRDIIEGKVDKELTQRIMASFDILNSRLQVYAKELARIKRDLIKINREIEMNQRELLALYSSDDKQCPICANYKFLESCYQCSFEMCTDCRGTQSKCPSCSASFADYKVEQKDKFYEKYGKYGDSIVSAIIMISPEAGNTYGADSSIGTMVVEMEKFVDAVNLKYEQNTGQKNKFRSLNEIIAFTQANPTVILDPMTSTFSQSEEEEFQRIAEMSRRAEEERYLRQLERERKEVKTVPAVESKTVDKTTMAGMIDEYLPNEVSLERFAGMSDAELQMLYNRAREKKRIIDQLINLQNIQDINEIQVLKTYDIDELRGILTSFE